MPYKDPRRKTEWELRHRPQRVARRRELRRIEAAQQPTEPDPPVPTDYGLGFLVPVIAGGALAAYNPQLAMGAGGLTVVVAALYKKGWTWWAVGILILALGMFFQGTSKNEKK
jgi:hypothetical protein